GSKNNPVIMAPKVVTICKTYIIKKPVVFLILPMKKAVNKAKYTNPNKRDIIILMNISKLSHIYTNPLWDLKEKRYERKNSKSKEIPIDISSAEEDLKIKKNERKQNAIHVTILINAFSRKILYHLSIFFSPFVRNIY